MCILVSSSHTQTRDVGTLKPTEIFRIFGKRIFTTNVNAFLEEMQHQSQRLATTVIVPQAKRRLMSVAAFVVAQCMVLGRILEPLMLSFCKCCRSGKSTLACILCHSFLQCKTFNQLQHVKFFETTGTMNAFFCSVEEPWRDNW